MADHFLWTYYWMSRTLMARRFGSVHQVGMWAVFSRCGVWPDTWKQFSQGIGTVICFHVSSLCYFSVLIFWAICCEVEQKEGRCVFIYRCIYIVDFWILTIHGTSKSTRPVVSLEKLRSRGKRRRRGRRCWWWRLRRVARPRPLGRLTTKTEDPTAV